MCNFFKWIDIKYSDIFTKVKYGNYLIDDEQKYVKYCELCIAGDTIKIYRFW